MKTILGEAQAKLNTRKSGILAIRSHGTLNITPQIKIVALE